MKTAQPEQKSKLEQKLETHDLKLYQTLPGMLREQCDILSTPAQWAEYHQFAESCKLT